MGDKSVGRIGNNWKELRLATEKFVNFSAWNDPFALTLTHKRACRLNGLLCYASVETYCSNLKHYMRIVEGRVYGRRGPQRLKRFPVLEPDAQGRVHYHLLIETPCHLSRPEFILILGESWRKTHWGHQHIDVRPAVSEGWVHYLTKSHSAGTNIDWENTYLPELQA